MSDPLYHAERLSLELAADLARLRDARMTGAWAKEAELWDSVSYSIRELKDLIGQAIDLWLEEERKRYLP